MLGDRPYGGRVPGRLGGRGAAAESCADAGREARRVALEHEQRDLVEHRLDPRPDRAASRSARRIRSAGVGLRALVGVEQLLVQLLARPPADDLDRDVAVRVAAPRARSCRGRAA